MTIDILSEAPSTWAEQAPAVSPRSDRRTAGEPARSALGLFRCAANKRLFAQGQARTEIFEVVEGTVILYRTLSGDRRQVVEIARAGALLGHFPEPCHQETGETRGDARLRRYSLSAFSSSQRLQGLASEQLDRRWRTTQELAVLLGRKTATERVATFLLRMLGVQGDSERIAAGRAEGRLDLTQADIADYLGLSVETVCREFSRLKKFGTIALDRRGHLIANDLLVLAKLAEGTEAEPVTQR